MADLLDEHGNPILLTDEQGNPVRLTDEHGNPVHLTGVATSRAAATEVGTGKGTHSTGPWNPRATTGYQATKTDTSWPHATAGTEHLANDPWSGTGGTGTGTTGTTTTTGHLGTEPWPHTATGGTGHHMEHHKGGMGLHDGGTGMEQHAPLGRVGMQCSEHHAPFKSSDAWVHGANPAGATDTRGAGFQPSKVDSERPKGESTTGLRRSGSSSSSSVDDSDDQELDRIAASNLRRAYWKNSEDIISDDHELESIVVHLMEKKVTVTRKSSSSGLKRKGSSRLRRSSSAVPALCRKLSHRASRVSWLSSLTCMGIYKGPILSQAKYAY
uniref:Uncharacterized protein n=1 Tax=Cannabis sativa TaxID=3483 RepID=A0A803Q9T2_CANSA